MINYTERLTALMEDIVRRVPPLSFIEPADVLLFARAGRSNAEGAFATCHCLTLPASEPGYYFWRDRSTHKITRRSEWFVTKSPLVTIGGHDIKYMISFALPRFCDQSLDRSRKERYYPGADSWIAKLDTVVHELYHIDPEFKGIRRIERGDGTYSANCHGQRFFEEVAQMVQMYLDSKPSPDVLEFLKGDFRALQKRHGGVTAVSFRPHPSFPQRYMERLAEQLPCEADGEGVTIEPLRVATPHVTHYTDEHIQVRQFTRETARRSTPRNAVRAA